jgi:hypothetical protein
MGKKRTARSCLSKSPSIKEKKDYHGLLRFAAEIYTKNAQKGTMVNVAFIRMEMHMFVKILK